MFFVGLIIGALKGFSLLEFFVLVYVSYIAYLDLKNREVENKVFVVFYIIGAIFAGFLKRPILGEDLVISLILFVAFFIIFYTKDDVVGGADVKAIFLFSYLLDGRFAVSTVLISLLISIIVGSIFKSLRDGGFEIKEGTPYLFCLQIAYIGGLLLENIF